MTDRLVTAPPVPLDPLFERLPAGATVFRVHEPVFPDGTSDDGSVFNPGVGAPLRWSFFGDPVVPVHYSSATPQGAVHESVLHDAVPGGHLARAAWERKVLTPLRVGRDVRLAMFYSEGLRRPGVHARDLTDTDADQYRHTVQWAEAAHGAGAEGVVWMSRQLNSVRAFCLFGDRVFESDLKPLVDHPAARVFGTPADSEWLYDVALRMRVTVRPLS